MNLDIDDEKDFLQGIAGEIGNVKNNCIKLEEYQAKNCDEDTFANIYHAYEKERKRLKKIDFDDMLVLTYELFQKRPDILKMWQSKYKYILIDEFQDINKVQYDVIRMLAEPENNLFIVGDDDQSIYKFRGANIRNILDFEKEFRNVKTIKLEQNYRSTGTILEAANEVIKNNEERLDKNLSKIYVGQILKIERHPDADKLIICQVDLGEAVTNEDGSHTLQIVTGAPNVKEGDKVKKGEPMMKVDMDYVKANAPSLATPVLCTELEEHQKIRLLTTVEIKKGEPLFAIDIYER